MNLLPKFTHTMESHPQPRKGCYTAISGIIPNYQNVAPNFYEARPHDIHTKGLITYTSSKG